MNTSSVGTGTITLDSAVPSFLTFAQAGAEDGDVITIAIEDGLNREIGRATYHDGATPTLSPRNVLKSTNGDNPINLSGRAQVAITAAAEDFGGLDGGTY